MFGWGSSVDKGQTFNETVLVHLDVLYRFALRLSKNRAEAEDLVQEACLRAFRHFHRFDPGTNARAWLLTILKNIYLNRARQAWPSTAEESASPSGSVETGSPSMPAAADNPEDEFFQTVLHGDIDRALGTLPVQFREAVVLVDLEGLRYKEVAEILDCPVGTVMSRLSRGRGLLREQLGRLAREHGYVKDR